MAKSLLLPPSPFFSAAERTFTWTRFLYSPQFITLSNIIDDARRWSGGSPSKICRVFNFNGKKSIRWNFRREFHKNSNRKGWCFGEILEILFCWEIIVLIGGDSLLLTISLSIAKCERNFIDKDFFMLGRNMNKFRFMRGRVCIKASSGERTGAADTKLLVLLIGDPEWAYCNLQMYFMMQQVTLASEPVHPQMVGTELAVGGRSCDERWFTSGYLGLLLCSRSLFSGMCCVTPALSHNHV